MRVSRRFPRHRVLNPILAKPIFLVVPLFTILVIFFWLFESRKEADAKTKVPRDLDAASIEIENQFEAIINYLELMAEESAKHELSRERVVADATRFVKDHPEVLRLVSLDARLRLRWVAPEENRRAWSIPFNRREIQDALPKALETGSRVFTRPFVAINGEHGMAVVVPPAVDDPLSGPFYALVSLERVLKTVVPRWVAQEYALTFLTEQNIPIAKLTDRRKADPDLTGVSRLQMGDVVLKLQITRYDEGIDWQMVLLFALSIGVTLGVSVSIVELGRDNKRKQQIATELARAKDLAESANAEKSKFLANMSHEIRTPIGAIIGYADMILAAPLGEDEKGTYVHAIRANGRNLLRLVNDILDLSKVEAGLLDVTREACRLPELINDVLTTMRPQAERKGLAMAFQVDGAIPETIWTDPLRLRQIFLNVLANAVKFTDAGGITVRAALEATPRGLSLAFRVVDTGVGIAPGDQAKIFRNFIQADSSIAKKYGGTGLGLSLSRSLAGLLGGRLELVRSASGEGSEFVFSVDPGDLSGVPMIGALPESLPKRAPVPTIGTGRRLAGFAILVVEDVADNRIILRRTLEAEGAHVALASNGLEAIRRVQAGEDFAVVLMDIQMPGLDGYQTTRALRDAGFAKPVVALTAHAMRDDREKCLAAGCNEYLAKPVDFERLILTIRGLVPRDGAANADTIDASAREHDADATPDAESPSGARNEHAAQDAGMASLTGGFIAGLPERMLAIEEAWEAGDVARMRALTHTLKGTAGLYGFPELASLCHGLEQELRREPWARDAVQAQWDKLIDAEREIRRAWQQEQAVPL